MLSNATAAAIALLETEASTGNPLSFSPGLVSQQAVMAFVS
jgi:hypothetical protein